MSGFTHLRMYIQIIDQSNIKLYDMVKEMGGTLIARKVDCAVVHYDSEQETKYIKPCRKKLTKKMTTENEKPTKVQIEGKYQILLQRYNTRVVEE